MLGPSFGPDASGGKWETFHPRCLPSTSPAIGAAVGSGLGAMFALIARGSASSFGGRWVLSPASTLLIASLVLAAPTSLRKLDGGACCLSRCSFRDAQTVRGSWVSHCVKPVVATVAFTNGVTTIVAGLLARRDVGLAETFIVRAALSAAFCFVLATPRNLSVRLLQMQAVRATFVTSGFGLAIQAIERGDMNIVQSELAVTLLLTLALEGITYR